MAARAPIRVPANRYYRPRRFDFRELPPEKLDYFLVLDFEANKGPVEVQEIIEFPVLKVNASTFVTESEFHSYVEPTINPKIDPFITSLTGITQDMVDGKPKLPEVLSQFDAWMKQEGLLGDGVRSCFVTCGDWDLKKALPVHCDYLDIRYPAYLRRWVNIKTCFSSIMRTKPGGMDKMLRHLHLELEGRHHSGIDDSRNIAKIVRELARRDSEHLGKGLVAPRVLVQQ